MTNNNFKKILKLAYQEDLLKHGDITSAAIFKKEKAKAILYSKDNGIIAGQKVFKKVFKKIDNRIKIDFYKKDGDRLYPGEKIALVRGKVVSILQAERIAINFISFLSGIATKTNEFVQIVRKNGKSLILDTRKTIPGYRKLSKYAVRIGGGKNHRMGLYDMVLIKDNHIDASGSITNAVNKIKKKWGNKYKIEVECRNLKDVKEALKCSIDVIMLDNMNLKDIEDAVVITNHQVKIEVSGTMDLNKVEKVSKIDIDFISVGLITKSVKAFDFSLKIKDLQ